MTRDDITRMAREAGFVGFDGHNGSLRRFAALVAAAERDKLIFTANRLAQPELQQRTGNCLLTGVCASEGHRIQKAQREWQGLTDEEITALKRNGERYISSQDFACAIETKLREKNG